MARFDFFTAGRIIKADATSIMLKDSKHIRNKEHLGGILHVSYPISQNFLDIFYRSHFNQERTVSRAHLTLS